MKITKKLITYWIFLTFVLFFGQNLLIFISVFVLSYPSGYITIDTNRFGELIFEIILSGIITLVSFIGIFILYKWEVKNN